MKVDGWNWLVGSGLYLADDLDAQLRKETLTELLFAVLALLIVGRVGWVVARSVVRQIGCSPAVPFKLPKWPGQFDRRFARRSARKRDVGPEPHGGVTAKTGA